MGGGERVSRPAEILNTILKTLKRRPLSGIVAKGNFHGGGFISRNARDNASILIRHKHNADAYLM